MKKALAILAALALVASAASAEVTVGGWGRGLFAVENTGATGAVVTNTDKASWGGSPRVGFTLAGSADKVGVVADLYFDSNAAKTASLGDQQLIWVKPIDQIKLTLGRAQMDTLRGNACFGSWDWDRDYGVNMSGGIGEDFTFQRLSTGYAGSATYDNKLGMVAEITPIEGLYIGLALRDVTGVNAAMEDSLKNGQYAIGYTIASVGTIRAQYIGHTTGTVNDSDFQAAFKLTAIENLYADVGFSMNLAANTAKKINLYGSYAVDKAKIHLAAGATLPSTGDAAIVAGLGFDYGFEGGIGVNADVRFNKPSTGANTISFMVGVTESLGNGLVGIAFQGANGATNFGYAIPVRFEYWF